MCDLCNRYYGWDERLLGDEQVINLGRLGKMKVTLSLRGDDIPLDYSLIAAVEMPQKTLAEIKVPAKYCPICGAKLFEDEADKKAKEKAIDEFVKKMEQREAKQCADSDDC